MTWSTGEIQYEGLPLLLRKPDYANIWQHKTKFTQLVSIEHLLDVVTEDGLPETKYNRSLSNFDEYMCTLFDKSTAGIIFLIETFAGKRVYHYYTLPYYKITDHINKAKEEFKVRLETTVRQDNDWGFFDAYPAELFIK